MLITGALVFLGVALILAKLPRKTLLKALHHDLAIDLFVSGLVLTIHWGTFSGVMATTVAGLMTSIATSGLKRLLGSVHRGRYYPGLIRLYPLGSRPL